jgi:hypothetical protein
MATLVKIHGNGQEEIKEQGQRVEAIQYDENGRNGKVVGDKPIVGCSLLVGSVTARSYSRQDWWLTTEILEILEETKEFVKFRTLNSIYELRP